MKPAVFQFTTAGVDASVDIALDAWRLTESQVVAILLAAAGDRPATLVGGGRQGEA